MDEETLKKPDIHVCQCGFKGSLNDLVLKPRVEFFWLGNNKEMAVYDEWFCPNCDAELYNDFGR